MVFFVTLYLVLMHKSLFVQKKCELNFGKKFVTDYIWKFHARCKFVVLENCIYQVMKHYFCLLTGTRQIVHIFGIGQQGVPCLFVSGVSIIWLSNTDIYPTDFKWFKVSAWSQHHAQVIFILCLWFLRTAIMGLTLAFCHPRDIKCANILVDTNGRIKVADFGLAKQVSANCFISFMLIHSCTSFFCCLCKAFSVQCCWKLCWKLLQYVCRFQN